VQIGNDRRLNAADVRRVLPPYYTIAYAVTLWSDEQLRDAISGKILRPDISRSEVQRWRKAYRECSRGADLDLPNATLASEDTAAVASTQTLDKKRVATRPNGEISSVVSSPDNTAMEDVAPPPKSPVVDEGIPAFLDRRPLPLEDGPVFDAILAAWHLHVQESFNSASEVVCERFISVLRTQLTSRKA
jgi:hypothetical protein